MLSCLMSAGVPSAPVGGALAMGSLLKLAAVPVARMVGARCDKSINELLRDTVRHQCSHEAANTHSAISSCSRQFVSSAAAPHPVTTCAAAAPAAAAVTQPAHSAASSSSSSSFLQHHRHGLERVATAALAAMQAAPTASPRADAAPELVPSLRGVGIQQQQQQQQGVLFEHAADLLSGPGFWEQLRPQRAEDIPEVMGHVHSVESFSAVDGPGVRFLTFLRGCGYRCVFCSNPDTWHKPQGQPSCSSKSLAARLDRVVPYLVHHNSGHHHHQQQHEEGNGGSDDTDGISSSAAANRGGITISGGEPLLQPDFVAAMCLEARVRGLTTCIDTTGQGARRRHWDVVLPHLDYALFCVKSPIKAKYEWITKRPMGHALGFCDELEARGIPYWVRYVLMPGFTDGPEDVAALAGYCRGRGHMRAVEVLPYHLLGAAKWQALGLQYPLEMLRTPRADETATFVARLRDAGVPVLCNAFGSAPPSGPGAAAAHVPRTAAEVIAAAAAAKNEEEGKCARLPMPARFGRRLPE